MPATLEQTLKENEQLVSRLSDHQIKAILALDKQVRRTMDSSQIREIIVNVLADAGYMVNPSKNEEEGIPLRTELELNGQESFGSLIPVNPAPWDLTPQDKYFLGEFAVRAGNVIDHARLYSEQERLREESQRLASMLAHEIKAPIARIKSLTSMLGSVAKESNPDHAQIDMLTSRLHYGANLMSDLSNLLYLGSMSKEDLDNSRSLIKIPRFVEEIAEYYDDHLKENLLGLGLNYAHTSQKPLEFEFDRGTFSAIWGTLLGNSIAYAPKGSVIRQGIREHDGYIELVMENQKLIAPKQTNFGMGKKMGFPFIKKIVHNVGGALETSNESQMASYNVHKQYGNHKSNHVHGYELFSTKVTIPKS